jgi:hypothetical protein
MKKRTLIGCSQQQGCVRAPATGAAPAGSLSDAPKKAFASVRRICSAGIVPSVSQSRGSRHLCQLGADVLRVRDLPAPFDHAEVAD